MLPIRISCYGNIVAEMSFHAVNRMFNFGQFISVSPHEIQPSKISFVKTQILMFNFENHCVY